MPLLPPSLLGGQAGHLIANLVQHLVHNCQLKYNLMKYNIPTQNTAPPNECCNIHYETELMGVYKTSI